MTAETDLGPSSTDSLVRRLLKDDPPLAKSLARLDLGLDELSELARRNEKVIRASASDEEKAPETARYQEAAAAEQAVTPRHFPVPFSFLSKRLIIGLGITLSGVVFGLSFLVTFRPATMRRSSKPTG